MLVRQDPGECPICGAAHTSCTASTGPIVVPQLPARDGALTATLSERIAESLPDGQFTTATYRGKKASK